MTTREKMSSLAEEIVRSCEDRINGIGQRRETVKMDLKGFQGSRTAMAREARADLSRETANRKHEVGSILNNFNAELKELNSTRTTMSRDLKAELSKSIGDRKHEVGVMLDGFGQALATMSKEVRVNLAEGVADRKREVDNILGGFSAELKEIHSELAGARDEWQKMIATMPSKRGGVAVKPLIEEIAEITPETATLRRQVFEYLANHPDGTKMTELEEEFGLARIQMAKIIRNLIDENKVEKRALLYFAV